MDPTVWGPGLWTFMHTLSFSYPVKPTKEEQQNMYLFFNNLKEVIPCDICKNHYIQFMKNNNITNSLNTRNDLIEWVLKCHNNVNIKNNKPTWSKDKLIKHYNNLYEIEATKNKKCSGTTCKKEHFNNTNCNSSNKVTLLYAVICVLLIIILYLFFYKKK